VTPQPGPGGARRVVRAAAARAQLDQPPVLQALIAAQP
jgi:hypothetical protein